MPVRHVSIVMVKYIFFSAKHWKIFGLYIIVVDSKIKKTDLEVGNYRIDSFMNSCVF